MAYGPTGQIWSAEMTFPNMGKAKWRKASGILSSLNGISGRLRVADTFRLKPLYNEENAGSSTLFSDDTGFSDGTGFLENVVPAYCGVSELAAAGADSLVLEGLPASISAIFNGGDLFEVLPNGQHAEHGHLYEITGQANSDADGRTRVYFQPNLRANVAVGDAVLTEKPTSVFRLASDQEAGVNRMMGDIGRVGFNLVEVLPN